MPYNTFKWLNKLDGIGIMQPVGSVHDFKRLILIWKGVTVRLTERIKNDIFDAFFFFSDFR